MNEWKFYIRVCVCARMCVLEAAMVLKNSCLRGPYRDSDIWRPEGIEGVRLYLDSLDTSFFLFGKTFRVNSPLF